MGWRSVILLYLLAIGIGICSGSVADQSPDHSHEIVAVKDSHAPGEIVTVKLRPNSLRTKAETRALGEKLKGLQLLAGTSLSAVARDLIVVTPTVNHNMEDLKGGLLQQPEIYELEIGEQTFRRPDDTKPYDDLKKELMSDVMSTTRSKVKDKIKKKIQSMLNWRKDKASKKKDSGDAGASNKEAKRGRKRQRRQRRRRSGNKAVGDGAGDGVEL